MDLRGGDPESTRSACVKLRDLAVAAEGPGAPFTATARGQQLLRLIHIVVQNVGLEDKVGALTALRLLKADDTLLQRLLKEGILPPLLAIIARDAADADGDWDDGSVVAGAGAAHLRLVRAETAAAAARAVEAFSSSGDSLTTLLRGGAVEALSDRLCRARGELADTPPARVVGENAENANGAASALGKARAATAAACDVALARISGSNLASAQDRDPFGNPLDDSLDDPDPSDGMDPGREKETRRRARRRRRRRGPPLFAGVGRRRGAPRRRRGFGETRLFRARGPNRHRAVRRRAPADDRRARRERRAESRRARRARRQLFARRARRVREPFPFG